MVKKRNVNKRYSKGRTVIEHHHHPIQEGINGIAVEFTYNWYWLVNGLIEKGYLMHLANTRAI